MLRTSPIWSRDERKREREQKKGERLKWKFIASDFRQDSSPSRRSQKFFCSSSANFIKALDIGISRSSFTAHINQKTHHTWSSLSWPTTIGSLRRYSATAADWMRSRFHYRWSRACRSWGWLSYQRMGQEARRSVSTRDLASLISTWPARIEEVIKKNGKFWVFLFKKIKMLNNYDFNLVGDVSVIALMHVALWIINDRFHNPLVIECREACRFVE